ncbi:MAG: winged helix-turn-helix transcriptional regulator [Candidatus Fonsibacter sp.]
MSDFTYEGKVFHNPVEFVLHKIGGTWKMPILWRLHEKSMRYGELKKSLSKITDKMLATQLRELEKDGFINRVVYPVVPPHTEYSLTEKGKRAIPIIDVVRKYGLNLMKEDGIKF